MVESDEVLYALVQRIYRSTSWSDPTSTLELASIPNATSFGNRATAISSSERSMAVMPSAGCGGGRTCGDECAERWGTAWCNPKGSEAKATEGIAHRAEGWSVRSTARLTKVGQDPVARLVRGAGRHAERCPDQSVHGLTPRALEFDEPWSWAQQSQNAVRRMPTRRPVTSGIIWPWRLTARWWWPCAWANGPMHMLGRGFKMPKTGFVTGTCRRFAPMPLPAMSRRCWRSALVVPPPQLRAVARGLLASGTGFMGKAKNAPNTLGSSPLTCARCRAKRVVSRGCICGVTSRSTRVW